jgi:flagellar FliL protein
MATAPKAAPKTAPKVVPIDEAVAAPVQKKSKKKSVVILAAALLTLSAGGGAAWYFLADEPAPNGAQPKKAEPAKPPVFVLMEPFTVNLQPDGVGEQYLQLSFSLQVADQAQVDQIKLYMPLVRSRLLLLLSSKKSSELTSVEGKKKLADEIIAQVKQPFAPNSAPVSVSGVFFTSFVIQ